MAQLCGLALEHASILVLYVTHPFLTDEARDLEEVEVAHTLRVWLRSSALSHDGGALPACSGPSARRTPWK